MFQFPTLNEHVSQNNQFDYFGEILSKAPLNTTHWKIDGNKFVRMGEAVVDGYLNLNILRRICSKFYINSLSKSQLKEIKDLAPLGAEALSMNAKKYVKCSLNGFDVVTDDGCFKSISQVDSVGLIFLDHIE